MFYVRWRLEQDLRIPRIFWCFCRWRRQYLAHRLIMLKILSQSGSIVVIALAGASLHERISGPLFVLYEALFQAHEAPHGVIKLLHHRYLLIRQ